MNRFKNRLLRPLKMLTKAVVMGLLCLLFLGMSVPGQNLAFAAGYTQLQQSQIQKFETSLRAASDRTPELGEYVAQEDWTNIRNFIHGPLGEVRRYMASINRNRPPKEQRKARAISKDLMGHIERLDAAAKDENSRSVQREYGGALEDLKLFLDSIPQF